jgi:hypothetical protein
LHGAVGKKQRRTIRALLVLFIGLANKPRWSTIRWVSPLQAFRRQGCLHQLVRIAMIARPGNNIYREWAGVGTRWILWKSTGHLGRWRRLRLKSERTFTALFSFALFIDLMAVCHCFPFRTSVLEDVLLVLVCITARC